MAAEPVYSEIAGAATETYVVQAEDIGCYVKAQYRGTGDFQGTKEAVSQLVKKNTQENPAAGVLALSTDPSGTGETLELQVTEGSYYQVRMSTDEIPAVPETVEAAQTLG